MQLFFLMIFSSFFAQNITACCKSLCTNKQELRQNALDKALIAALLDANFDQVLLALAGGARAYNIIAHVDAEINRFLYGFLYGNKKIFKLLLVSLFCYECLSKDRINACEMIAKKIWNRNDVRLLKVLERVSVFYKTHIPIDGFEDGKSWYIVKLRTSLGHPPKLYDCPMKLFDLFGIVWRNAYDAGYERYSERENEFLEVFKAIPYDLRGPLCNADVPPTFTTKTIYFDRLGIFMTSLDETFQQTATGRVPLEVVGIIKDYFLDTYEEHLRLAGCYDLQDELKQLEEQLAAAREQEKDKEVEQARCVIM